MLLEYRHRKLSEVGNRLDIDCDLKEGEGLAFLFSMAVRKRIPFQIGNEILRATRTVEEMVDLEKLQDQARSREDRYGRTAT